jgi:hypothetical protein
MRGFGYGLGEIGAGLMGAQVVAILKHRAAADVVNLTLVSEIARSPITATEFCQLIAMVRRHPGTFLW